MKLSQILIPPKLQKINWLEEDDLNQVVQNNNVELNEFLYQLENNLESNNLIQEFTILDCDFRIQILEMVSTSQHKLHYVAIVQNPLNKSKLIKYLEKLKLSKDLKLKLIRSWPQFNISQSIRIKFNNLTIDLHFTQVDIFIRDFTIPISLVSFLRSEPNEIGYTNYFDLKINLDNLTSVEKLELESTQRNFKPKSYDLSQLQSNKLKSLLEDIQTQIYQSIDQSPFYTAQELLECYYLVKLSPNNQAQLHSNQTWHIAGAGIAGSSIAYHFKQENIDCIIYDPEETQDKANPRGLIYSQLMDDDSSIALATINGYQYSQALYAQLDHVQESNDKCCETTVIKFIKELTAGYKNNKTLIGCNLIQQSNDYYQIEGAVICPQQILIRLTNNIQRLFTKLTPQENQPTIFATSYLLEKNIRNKIQSYPIRGQLEVVETDNEFFKPLCANSYAIHFNQNQVLIGATHVRNDSSSDIKQEDIDYNLNQLKQLHPDLTFEHKYSKVGIRAGIRDRKPIFGVVYSDHDLADKLQKLDLNLLRENRIPQLKVNSVQYAIGAFASRGYTYAPWFAMIIVDLICGRRPPISPKLMMSFAINRIKLKEIAK